MSRDFFLLNRCYQLGRLCGTGSHAVIAIPAEQPRNRLPAKLAELYSLIRRLCELAAAAPAANLTGRSATQDASGVRLTDSQRRDLEEFERAIVACRFAADPQIKQPAVTLIRAIFADAEYFSGLKPLPQYTEAFAYELLFPSWLNLLKACMLPRAQQDGKSRLAGESQGALFEFLAKCSGASGDDQQLLVGFLTFIASRFDTPHCEELLQRCVDLVHHAGLGLVATLDKIDSASRDARELRERVADVLNIKFSLLPEAFQSAYRLAYRRPARRVIPAILATKLQELEDKQQWNEYFQIAHPVRCLIESEYSFTPSFVALLQAYPQQLSSLLSLLGFQQPCGRWLMLCPAGQDCLAAVIKSQPELLTSGKEQLAYFSRQITTRLTGMGESDVEYFQRVLVDDANGRRLLLEACGKPDKLEALAAQLQARAGTADDHQSFLKLINCTCILSPRPEALEALKTLQAIQAVIDNRSIGNKELADLVTDLQSDVQQTVEVLASPMMAAGKKSDRLAALYLTLNEMSQKLQTTGTVDNFSVVRAKYAKLTNLA